MTEQSSDTSGSNRRVLQAIYDELRERGTWPTFAQIDRVLDRRLGIEDAQAALAALPAEWVPRAWGRVGYSDTDEIRLTLRGVASCAGSESDLRLLVSFLRWAADQERRHEGDDPVTVSSTEFARVVGLEPGDETEDARVRDDISEQTIQAVPPDAVEARNALARVGVLANLISTFWTSSGYKDERWHWTFTLSRGVRKFRDLRDETQLLQLDDEFRREIDSVTAQYWAGGQTTSGAVGGAEEAATAEAAPLHGFESLDVLMTLLRPEIADAAGTQLRAGLYDDAIFAAYRRVEHEIQQRTGLTSSIGDLLVKQAFRDAKDPITISARTRDADRMIEIFGGAIGLHKGDRSHKDKPALPCRSQRECLRLLAQASALFDLLDRGGEQAPRVDGYQQRGDELELSVQRAGPTASVWLGDRPCRVRGHTSSTLTVDIAGVSAGLHDLYVVGGTRQGPAVPVFITREPGRTTWYRVTEIGIELFRDESADRYTDVFGLRLDVLESGLRSERIVPASERYEVGDYVNWGFSTRSIGPVWMRHDSASDLLQLYIGSALFNGDVIGPGQEPRTIRVSLEPPVLKLRRGDKTPMRALRHVSDGIATWTERLDDPCIESDDGKVAHYKDGVVFAKQDGSIQLRLRHDGLYCAASVEVAAHPFGSTTDVLTGLPPVAGIAWTGDQLVISTRGSTLSSVRDGKYGLLAALPTHPPTFGGTDTIAAAPNGDLAVRLTDRRGVLLLPATHDYRRSRWVELPDARLITAMAWSDTTLTVGTDNGEIWQVAPTRQQRQIGSVGGFVISLAAEADTLYVLVGSGPRRLLRLATTKPHQAEEVVGPTTIGDVNFLACIGKDVYLTEFHKGQLLALDGASMRVVADGLSAPCAITSSDDGCLYVAEFGRGAVRRVFP